MGINTAWISESGEPKHEVFDYGECLSRLATSRWRKLQDTKCIQFIEPWGDAVFNPSQVPHLLSELRAEMESSIDPKFKTQLEKVIGLVERAVGQTHTYIKFSGD